MKDLHTLDKYRDRDFGYRIHGGPGDAANVVPVARGHWERDRDTIKCSECGFGMFPIRPAFRDGDCVPYSGIPNHCPDCGVRMEVPNDD